MRHRDWVERAGGQLRTAVPPAFMPNPKRRALLGGVVGLGAGALALASPFGPRAARACGVFSKGPRLPSLSRELALIVFDPDQHLQHFYRELVFREAKQPFGFVIPTPSEPSIHAAKNPFDALEKAFPYEPPAQGPLGLSGIGGGPGVTIKREQEVGSFSATVLTAESASGLTDWLRANELLTSSAASQWLERYVRMKFHFVAMRYNPAASANGSLRAEAYRLSFRTPLPYYPYAEPLAGDSPLLKPRSLTTWLLAPRRYTPVCLRSSADGKPTWVRAWREGRTYADTNGSVRQTLPQAEHALLPERPLIVQVFQDSKDLRDGYGDILFAPAQSIEFSREELELLRPLLGILDPELLP
jgi:hypothetical protein